MLIHNFDEKDFPLIVSSGYDTMNLININTGRTQTLIKKPVYGVGPQETFFFKREVYGFSLSFVSRKLTE